MDSKEDLLKHITETFLKAYKLEEKDEEQHVLQLITTAAAL